MAAILPISEYLNTSYRPDCDYLDGQLPERNVGEWDHSRMQALLSRSLSKREREWGILVLMSLRVHVSPTRIRVPDIVVIAGAPPDEQILTTPPFLCIEILSPSDRVMEMQERIDDYLMFGVSYVWLINPRTRETYIYTQSGLRESKDGILTTNNPDIRVDLSSLD